MNCGIICGLLADLITYLKVQNKTEHLHEERNFNASSCMRFKCLYMWFLKQEAAG
jgi:hypothetical protein